MSCNFDNLRKYIERCFVDAFKAENKEYNRKLWTFEWVVIKNCCNMFQFFPVIAWCEYDRVLRRVIYRLKNNLQKNFEIHYGETDNMRVLFYTNGQIDPNFTQFMFKTERGNVSMSIFDEKSDNKESGECMPAYRFEKLLFQYWGLNAKTYSELADNDQRKHLPDSIQKDWCAFKDLYEKIFGNPIGNDYEVICSSGIKRI